MILIHIKKENREPKIGEWTEKGQTVDDDQSVIERYYDGRPLSITVILDAPETHGGFKNTHWIDDISLYTQYPISNSEEIFQWLHDNGKLGEEWVEWESYSIFDKKKGIVELPISPDQKTKPCPSWKECTAKEPRHCALNGCEKVREEEETCPNLSCDETYIDWSERLFNHMAENHDINLTDTELSDIYSCIVKFDPEKDTKRFNKHT